MTDIIGAIPTIPPIYINISIAMKRLNKIECSRALAGIYNYYKYSTHINMMSEAINNTLNGKINNEWVTCNCGESNDIHFRCTPNYDKVIVSFKVTERGISYNDIRGFSGSFVADSKNDIAMKFSHFVVDTLNDMVAKCCEEWVCKYGERIFGYTPFQLFMNTHSYFNFS